MSTIRIRAAALAIAFSICAARAALAQCYASDSIAGPEQYAFFGESLAGIGDVDSDGYDDFIVGAPGFAFAYSGLYYYAQARVYSGRTRSMLYRLGVSKHRSNFGWSVSRAGDVDGDGHEDIIVGAPYERVYDLGVVRVYSGPDGRLLHTLTFSGSSGFFGPYFGWSVSGAGDVNADGFDDLIVGAPYEDGPADDSGSVRVFSGRDGLLLYVFFGTTASAHAGEAISEAGDVDGDGHDDVMVGLPWDDASGIDAGAARVFSGADGSVLLDLLGETSGDHFGRSVDSAGDIDGDGFDDVLVGEPGHGAGRARIFSGANGSVLQTFVSAGVSALGRGVSKAGDVDGDGRGDFILDGDPTIIVSGADGTRLLEWPSQPNSPQRVIGAGDLDGDGLADLLVGQPNENGNGIHSGRVVLLPRAPLVVYGNAKSNSQGCLPAISFTGMPSASSSSPFLLHGSNLVSNRRGFLFYGTSRAAIPFQLGTLCVGTPVRRTPLRGTGGNSPQVDCSGTLVFDFNAWVQSGADPLLVAGSAVYAQFWYFDPGDAFGFGSGFTNAVQFTLCP